MEEATKVAREAEREHRRTLTAYYKEKLSKSLRALATTVIAEKTKTWRATL